MLQEAIFLATCNATFVALQVARKNSRVTPHFETAIVALRVARKVERLSTFLACEYSRLSFAPATTCETRRQTSAIHRQKFHTDDVTVWNFWR